MSLLKRIQVSRQWLWVHIFSETEETWAESMKVYPGCDDDSADRRMVQGMII